MLSLLSKVFFAVYVKCNASGSQLWVLIGCVKVTAVRHLKRSRSQIFFQNFFFPLFLFLFTSLQTFGVSFIHSGNYTKDS